MTVSSWVTLLMSLFSLAKTFYRFLSEGAPDLAHQPAEAIRGDDGGVARVGQVDVDHGLDLAGARGHDQDAVGELHRLVDVVRYEDNRLVQSVADFEQLLAEDDAGLLVESAEGLVHLQSEFDVAQSRAPGKGGLFLKHHRDGSVRPFDRFAGHRQLAAGGRNQ